MAERDERVTVRIEELALSNSITLTALVELLEQRGILKQAEVIERVRTIRERKRAG